MQTCMRLHVSHNHLFISGIYLISLTGRSDRSMLSRHALAHPLLFVQTIPLFPFMSGHLFSSLISLLLSPSLNVCKSPFHCYDSRILTREEWQAKESRGNGNDSRNDSCTHLYILIFIWFFSSFTDSRPLKLFTLDQFYWVPSWCGAFTMLRVNHSVLESQIWLPWAFFVSHCFSFNLPSPFLPSSI